MHQWWIVDGKNSIAILRPVLASLKICRLSSHKHHARVCTTHNHMGIDSCKIKDAQSVWALLLSHSEPTYTHQKLNTQPVSSPPVPLHPLTLCSFLYSPLLPYFLLFLCLTSHYRQCSLSKQETILTLYPRSGNWKEFPVIKQSSHRNPTLFCMLDMVTWHGVW